MRKMLVIVDPTVSGPQAAVTKGGVLASRSGAVVELVACELASAAAGEERHEGLQRQLDELAAPLLINGIHVKQTSLKGSPLHDALTRYIRDSRADWVVKGTHAHRLASGILTRSTDWHLINDCPVPLLLTKSTEWGRIPVIMAALDATVGDAESMQRDPKILESAFWLSQMLGGALHVVHAYPPQPTVPELAGAPHAPPLACAQASVETECEKREQQYAQVSEFVRRSRIRPQDLHVDVGSVASYLPRVASREHADIVVMGAGPPGGAIPILHEGMAARVLDSLPCDLLVLR